MKYCVLGYKNFYQAREFKKISIAANYEEAEGKSQAMKEDMKKEYGEAYTVLIVKAYEGKSIKGKLMLTTKGMISNLTIVKVNDEPYKVLINFKEKERQKEYYWMIDTGHLKTVFFDNYENVKIY